MSEVLRDGRRVRGERSRRAIVRHAADVASVHGLDGLSLGRLAGDLELSKSGVQALFGSKEKLQLAVVDAARELFVAAVVTPALAAEAGLPRLRALLAAWLDYAGEPLFPGGCFWSVNVARFAAHPGPVRDALAAQQRQWRAVLAEQVRHASAAGQLGALDAELTAFQLDATLNATNVVLRLGEDGAPRNFQRAVDRLLGTGG